jgi:hypothetical protein
VEVGVDHGGGHAGVTELALHLGHPHARPDELGGQRVAPAVGVVASGQAGPGGSEADLSLQVGDGAAPVGVGTRGWVLTKR